MYFGGIHRFTVAVTNAICVAGDERERLMGRVPFRVSHVFRITSLRSSCLMSFRQDTKDPDEFIGGGRCPGLMLQVPVDDAIDNIDADLVKPMELPVGQFKFFSRRPHVAKLVRRDAPPLFVKKFLWNDRNAKSIANEIRVNTIIREYCSKRVNDARHFAKFEGWSWADIQHTTVFLFFEWIESDWKHSPGTIQQTRQRLLNVLEGLSILHEHLGIIHGDLKPDNIMIRKNGTAALCDFGCAFLRGGPDCGCKTSKYRYPGVERGWSCMIDLYSVGMIMLYMINCHERDIRSTTSASDAEFDQQSNRNDHVDQLLRTCGTCYMPLVETLLGRHETTFQPHLDLDTRADALNRFLPTTNHSINHTTTLTSRVYTYLQHHFEPLRPNHWVHAWGGVQ